MKPRTLFASAAALLAILAALWLLCRDGEQALPRAAPPAMPAPTSSTEAPIADLDRHELPPAPLTTAEATPAPSGLPPTQVEPWLARFLVVERHVAPVADAVVTIRAAAGDDPGGMREPGRLLFEVRTDRNGCAEAMVDVEVILALARKDGVGTSFAASVHKDHAEDRTRLRLDAPVLLRGIALHADGRPAAGAEVTATRFGSRMGSKLLTPPAPATAGYDGRFELELFRRECYRLQARLGDLRSFQSTVIAADASQGVTLTFPGSNTIGGYVVDAKGKPVRRALVLVWREPSATAATATEPMERAYSGDDGSFSVAVRSHARYEVIAKGGSDRCSNLATVETTASWPHAKVRLDLQDLRPIRGRVVRGDGSPLAGVPVRAEPEAGRDPGSGGATRADRFPRVSPVVTTVDGAFRLEVHPDTTWTLIASVVPDNPALRVWHVGVKPGDDGVVVQVRDADLTGCVVHGTVARVDGQPVGRYEVRIIAADPRRWGGSEGNFREPRFRCTAVPLGGQYTLVVSSRKGDVAPAQIGPFAADRAEIQVEARLSAWGELPVLVLDASGVVARDVRVQIVSAVPSNVRYPPRAIEADGRAVLAQVTPGANTLRILDDDGSVCEQEVVVQSGQNAEVVVRLPASK